MFAIAMDALTQFELLSIVGALIGMWLKFQNDFTSVKSRVRVLEADNGELKQNIKQLLEDIQEIKLLLAKNQVQ
jgi:Tfp pilus assembly protein PilN